jgi:hypothetical protein
MLAHPPASQNVVDVMSEENHQQQTCDATNPEEKMLGQLWRIDLFLVHGGSILPNLVNHIQDNGRQSQARFTPEPWQVSDSERCEG